MKHSWNTRRARAHGVELPAGWTRYRFDHAGGSVG
jgi:hypothetical protein